LSYSFKKLLLFEIPYSIFDIQNAKHAKAIRLKGEGFKPGEWKNKLNQVRDNTHEMRCGKGNQIVLETTLSMKISKV
jgi:hypothetical protein